MHPAVPRRRIRPATLFLSILLLVAGVLLTGCVRMKAAMAVSDDDHVSGQIVAAAVNGGSDTTLAVPGQLSDRAQVKPYNQDGYQGTQLAFNELSFDELKQLMAASPGAAQHYQFGLHRSGSVLTISGMIDLSQLDPAKADLGVKINVPGKVTASNGTVDNEGTITWLPQPGKINELSATVITDNGTVNPLVRWGFGLGLLAGAVALIVVVLAVIARRRTLHAERD